MFFECEAQHVLFHLHIPPKIKRKSNRKFKPQFFLQQKEDVKSMNHSVPFESDSKKENNVVYLTIDRKPLGTHGLTVRGQSSECIENDRPV